MITMFIVRTIRSNFKNKFPCLKKINSLIFLRRKVIQNQKMTMKNISLKPVKTFLLTMDGKHFNSLFYDTNILVFKNFF